MTLDKLVAMNPDIKQFLETVMVDLNANKIHDAEYDAVTADADLFAEELAGSDGKAKKGRSS